MSFTPGRLATEEDAPNAPIPRVASEQAAASVAARGVRVSVMRLPQVHDPVKQGLVTYVIACSSREGCLGVCRRRAQPLARGAPARCCPSLQAGAGEGRARERRYHAVAEEGVPVREIAEAIGRGLKVPVVANFP